MDKLTPSRLQNIIVGLMAVVILGFCAFGFGSKFIELVSMVKNYDSQESTEGVFAVAPLSNYLLASAGFLCLLGWAATQGMFTDIEGPKQTMLDREFELDAMSGDGHYSDSILQK